MDRPAAHWHHESLDEDIISNLDAVVGEYEDRLCDLARFHKPEHPRETPEFLAKQIGFWMVERNDNPDLETPVKEDTCGDEGKKLALGYIGIQAFEMAGVTFPDSE